VKTWLDYGTWDYVNYSKMGHPFVDYRGNWTEKDCGGRERHLEKEYYFRGGINLSKEIALIRLSPSTGRGILV